VSADRADSGSPGRVASEPAPVSSAASSGARANVALALIAVATVLLEWIPGFRGPYGYFIDELYYLACADRLAWGYVDHPPLSIAVLALVRAVAGDSLAALRLVPALAAGATAVVTGLIARRLGAGAFGQALAAGAMALAGIPMVIFSFYSMNALDILMWAVCFRVLVEIEERGEPRLWLLFGAALGVGLMNKHTMVLLVVGLVPGMLLTRARRHLASPWFWAGLVLAGTLLSPNLFWQARHGWPSLEFYYNADVLKNNPTPPLAVLVQQVLYMNPGALPIWLGGLVFLLGRGRAGRLRHLGWAYLLLLAMLALGQKSRPDRLTPAYPVLFAAGGAALGGSIQRFRAGWLRPVLASALVLGGAVFVPLGLPLLPPTVTGPYGQRLGIVPQIERGEGKRAELPQWLADRLDWEKLVDDVARVVETLPDSERSRAMILAPSYGEAGAIELFGRKRGLPPVYSGHNNYYLWGPPPDPLETVIVIGRGERDLREFFGEVERAHVHRCQWCMPWRDNVPIWVARHPTGRIADKWPEMKHYQ